MKKAGILIPAFFLLTICNAGGQVYFDELYGQTATADGIPTGGTIETPNGYLVLSTEYDGQDNHYAFIVDAQGQFQYGFYIEENDTIGEFGGSVLRYSDTLLIGMAQWRNLNQPSTVSGDLMLTGFNEDGSIYWRRKYGEELRGEYPISYMITNDGGFAVVGQVAVYNNAEIDGQVYVEGKKLKIGCFYNIKITDAYEYDLTGEYESGK
jgi:hypothetical protein